MDVVGKFGRILIPMSTAFAADYSIDYPMTRRIASYLISKNYCDSLVIAGTNGEFYSMTFEEKVRLFAEVKQEVGERVPLIAGTGTANTHETIELTKEAARLGYDAAMVVVPYYCHPTQEGIYYHFSQICKNTDLPIMVYNIPLFTASNIDPSTLAKLTEFENIVAVKDEAGINPLQTSAFLKATEGKIVVYSGDDLMVLSVMSQGGIGVISGGSHVIGDMMRNLIEEFLSGDATKATGSFKELYSLFSAFFGRNRRLVNPLPAVKKAFALHSGLDVARVRPPLMEIEEDEVAVLKDTLRKFGKIS
jgi:4-hydroxy-tetrahydrodipicolinate synthase